ncbi:ATP synthase gamma chain [Frankliniella fusca]|uniref:ATP synthase gamma chain n=1 Tax=Frankliniella fusca TaxID=407009 RepID=A0AAE1HXT5_9NEOP|nr:ATP synthase gamma chain [Frankliniella fusca]
MSYVGYVFEPGSQRCFSLACRRHAESGLEHESHEGLGALTAPPSQSGHGPGQAEGCDATSPHHLAFGL